MNLTKNLLTFALLFLVGLILIFLVPPEAAFALTLLLPIVAVASVTSVTYLAHLYRDLEPPKPVFYTMLLGATIVKTSMGVLIGYIAVASLLRQTGVADLPAPRGVAVAAFVALVIAVLISPPIFYAASIFRNRRQADL